MNRLDADEIVQRALGKKTRGAGAAGALAVNFNERAEAGFFAVFQFMCQNEFEIEDVFHFVAQDVGKAAGHAGTEIEADGTEDCGDAAGHVFATVLADAFDDGSGAAVANGKPFADLSRNEELARCGAVENCVACEDVAALAGVVAGANGDGAAGEAFADVSICFAVETQAETIGKKSAEALASGAAEFMNRWSEPGLLEAEAHAFAAEVAADASMEIVNDGRTCWLRHGRVCPAAPDHRSWPRVRALVHGTVHVG